MVPAVMTSHIHCTTDENLVSHPGYVYLLSVVVVILHNSLHYNVCMLICQ